MLSDEDKLAIQNLFNIVKRFRYIDYFSKPFAQVLRKDSQKYTETIKNPMDLGTLKNNFENNKYSTLKEFKDDLNLIWLNLYKYQGCDNELGKAAKRIEKSCADYLSKHCKNTEDEKEDSTNLSKKRKRETKETKKDQPKTANNNKKNNQNNTQVKQLHKKGKKKKQKNTKTSKSQMQTNNSCLEDGNKIDKISTTDDSEFSCLNTNQDKISSSTPNLSRTNDVQENLNEQSNTDLKIDFSSENNKSQKIIPNTNNIENITAQEKEQFLILITKLTVPNQVNLICKIEEYDPDIITIFSGNIDISFNIMTKNIYTQIMQHGQSLLEAQTKTNI